MPQLDVHDFVPQLIWLAITFAALYLVMARLALPRIGAVIEQRRDRVASDLDQADQFKRKSEETIAAYEQALAEARAKAHGIGQEAREKLNAEVAAERAEAERRIAAKTAEAESRIAAAKDQALGEVQEIAAGAAGDIVERLIGTKATKAEITSAVGAAQGERVS